MNEHQKVSTSGAIGNLQVRQHLVDTAVNFLINPDVRNQTNHSKAAFLRKKGLSDSEISAAFEKANVGPGNISTASKLSDQRADVVPHTLPYSERILSFWSRLNRISTSLAVLALALYGLHRFYKLYVEPWLFGTRPEQSKNPMEELMAQLNNSICELKTAVSTLESTVNSQKEQIDQVLLCQNTPFKPIPLAVAELKSEIGSLKSLLINRHQFPAVPKVYNPSIPLWQLADSESENAESESIANKLSVDTVEDKCIELKSETAHPMECDKPYFDQSCMIFPKKMMGNDLQSARESQLPDSESENAKSESIANEFSGDTVEDKSIKLKSKTAHPMECDKPYFDQSCMIFPKEMMGKDLQLARERQLDSESKIAEYITIESSEQIASKMESCDPRECDEPDSNQSLVKAAEINGVETKTVMEKVADGLEFTEKINSILQSDEPMSPSALLTLVKDHFKMNGSTLLEDASEDNEKEFKDAIQSSD